MASVDRAIFTLLIDIYLQTTPPANGATTSTGMLTLCSNVVLDGFDADW